MTTKSHLAVRGARGYVIALKQKVLSSQMPLDLLSVCGICLLFWLSKICSTLLIDCFLEWVCLETGSQRFAKCQFIIHQE